MKLFRSLLFSALTLATTAAAEPVRARLDLLERIKAGAVEYHVNPKADFHDAPKDIWTFAPSGELKVSGRGYGYVATRESFCDYHLVLEFKWGEKTWGKRETRARDNGVLLHARGPHGAYGDTWMASIECQIIEGGTGDLLVLSPKLADGTELTASVRAEIALDRDGEKLWKKGAPRETVMSGRVNWAKRDVDWVDRKGYRGRDDVESAPGGWNRLEVIARGATLQYFLNGLLVNEAWDAQPAEGRVCLQTEGAEMFVRRYELWPLGAFTEKWNPIQASGGSDISVREGQSAPLSPEESLRHIQLDGPYEAQLVAAEPLVLDPVECCWDARGRMFVAEMRDYPLGPPTAGDPWLSRIRMLTDEDGDGRMDRAVTFAEHVDHVQGLLPFRDGLIATTRTQILFLKDSDGDGKADVSEPLITGFNPRHSQLQVSAPRWGLDNCVYFNNGLDAKEVYPAAANAPVAVPRSNFRWHPATGKLEPVSGYGQYGGAFDDWGRYFFCTNRSPVLFAVMPIEAVQRNPHAGITQGWEDIAPAGAETRVYPLKITHTTADAHAGSNTACSGLGVYRGDLMPEMRNDIFVPDPTGQLVTRYRVEPRGASLRATRVGERTEFFRSSDEWSRPVNVATGPDGALYICDMYRRWIDHARFFPEEFVKKNDMRQGEHQGRIWRIVPRGATARKIEPAPANPEAWLTHENGWQRDTARRLLAERGQPITSVPEKVEDAKRKLFFEILAQPDGAGPTAAETIARRAAALEDSPDDEWMAKAVLSASAQSCGAVLQRLVAGGKFSATASPARSTTLRSLASASAAAGASADFTLALAALPHSAGDVAWWQPPLVQGLADGLPKPAGKLGVKTLAELVAKPPAEFKEAAARLAALLARVEAVMSDPRAPLEARAAVLPLLAQQPWKKAEPLLRSLLAPGQPAALAQGAFAVLKKYPADTIAPLLYDLLPAAGPALRRDIVTLLSASTKTALDLFRRMERGEISASLVEMETRWRWQRGTGELRDLAVKLFGSPSQDRAAVIAQYMDATKLPGDARRGQQVFATLCITCHRHGALGAEVGPPLSDVRAKPPEALLSDILDPNRMVEARWCAYVIDTKDGRVLSGLIAAESDESVTLKLLGGATETIPRSNIAKMVSTDRSLMPPGLEGAITKEQMADLLAFLRGP